MKKGFTLLEVILAIFFLTVATAGSSVLITQTIGSISIVKSKLVASYLAQEGVEIVRNIRDSNWLEQRFEDVSWDDDLKEGNWELDYTTTSFNKESEGHYNSQSYNNNFLKLPLEGGYYNYVSGEDTAFKRKITISEKEDTSIPLDETVDRLKVSVEVSWEERGRTHSVNVVEYLYNWSGYN